jgi:transcriptional regulator with XRE-family HTH domain
MYIAETLKELWEAKQLSQGDIEKRTGLLRCYISRVERGHTVPSIDTLGKIATALEIPMYQLFYAQEKAAADPLPPSNGKKDWTSSCSGMRYIAKLTHALSRTSEAERELLLYTARRMTAASHRKRR